MTTHTLSQAVHPNDLILIYSDNSWMVLVTTAPENERATSASAITMQEVNYHNPACQGFWKMSGPEVVYVDEIECDMTWCAHNKPAPRTLLSSFLDSAVPKANERDDPNTTMVVNPHGRDVPPPHEFIAETVLLRQ
ncbi:hypothetical protein NUU61_002973 [Penicillium alfredii]|uniref:Uncharacterized protein n=1 Tax=Penicillium alfredii TaxID=1506179 RepID=A0A9W9FSH5_9EURO|nr:uncharacterized protein NUU61_002973 [Penicillium alfredii]KAJ5105626.1 hypothetical protein NUU61_002973 [Penicillium alfredii]